MAGSSSGTGADVETSAEAAEEELASTTTSTSLRDALTNYEYWKVGRPETTQDENGLIDELNIDWHTVAEFEMDDNLYDMYEGATTGWSDSIDDDELNELWGRVIYYETFGVDAEGVAPFLMVEADSMGTDAGFSVGYDFGGINRPWFETEVIVSDSKRDYSARYGQNDEGKVDTGGKSKTLLKNMFDRRPSDSYSFADTFNNLVDTYVQNIYNSIGDLRETSATYKQSTKRPTRLKDTSTFDLDKFEKSGATVTTSTVKTALTTGEY